MPKRHKPKRYSKLPPIRKVGWFTVIDGVALNKMEKQMKVTGEVGSGGKHKVPAQDEVDALLRGLSDGLIEEESTEDALQKKKDRMWKMCLFSVSMNRSMENIQYEHGSMPGEFFRKGKEEYVVKQLGVGSCALDVTAYFGYAADAEAFRKEVLNLVLDREWCRPYSTITESRDGMYPQDKGKVHKVYIVLNLNNQGKWFPFFFSDEYDENDKPDYDKLAKIEIDNLMLWSIAEKLKAILESYKNSGKMKAQFVNEYKEKVEVDMMAGTIECSFDKTPYHLL